MQATNGRNQKLAIFNCTMLIFLLIFSGCGPSLSPISPSPTMTPTFAALARATKPPATPTPLPTSTPWPTSSPTPIPIVVEDTWVTGYIMGSEADGCPFQVGQFRDGGNNPQQRCLTLVPANEVVAGQLTAVPPGDTLLQLNGRLNPTTPQQFTVNSLTYVNLPYTPQTPLNATYSSHNWGITFNYPAGWTQEQTADSDTLTITSMPPGAVNLRPGREHRDPTEYRFTLRPIEITTLAEWRENYASLTEPRPILSELNIGSWQVVRAEWAVHGVVIEYGVAVNGRLFIFTTNDISEAFMVRVLGTLQPLVYPDTLVCGYHSEPGRFQVGYSSVSSFIQLNPIPANDAIAHSLAAFPYGDTFLQLTGTITPTTGGQGDMLVTHVQQVTLPYTPETPLTAVFTTSAVIPELTIRYPARWLVDQQFTSSGTILTLHNTPPDTPCLRPGREHADPTDIWLQAYFPGGISATDYIASQDTANECGPNRLQTAAEISVGGWRATRLQLDNCPFGFSTMVVMEINGRVVAWRTHDQHEAFMMRVLETLTVP